jgi:S-DNA-T family DNA segregation ATPase FtsK/SpoIIIE
VLRWVATAGRDQGFGLLLAGTPDSMMTTIGWIGVARRARRGMLLGPKSMSEGELIGVRLGTDHLRPSAVPGRAWVADGAGQPAALQVPLAVLQG